MITIESVRYKMPLKIIGATGEWCASVQTRTLKVVIKSFSVACVAVLRAMHRMPDFNSLLARPSSSRLFIPMLPTLSQLNPMAWYGRKFAALNAATVSNLFFPIPYRPPVYAYARIAVH